MAAYFFDSSALVKRFARETGTSWVISLLKPANGNRIYIARITYVEVISARLAENYSLGAYDAVLLAAALEIHTERQKVNAQPIILISADNDLNAAASSESLFVDNPNLHP